VRQQCVSSASAVRQGDGSCDANMRHKKHEAATAATPLSFYDKKLKFLQK